MDAVRRQFETNVFGLLRLTPTGAAGDAPPGLGQDRQPQLDGRPADLPGGGFYHATKHAVEAISDALRFEVRGFGIDVIIVEPGLIKTAFGDTAVARSTAPPTDEGPTRSSTPRLRKTTANAYEGGSESSVPGRTPSRTRSRRRSQPAGRGPLSGDGLARADDPAPADARPPWDALMRTQFPSPGR